MPQRMNSDDLASMYAQILNGVPKEESRFVVDDFTSMKWDRISGQVNDILRENPNAQFDIPNEAPSAD